jgi:hypothetical protein
VRSRQALRNLEESARQLLSHVGLTTVAQSALQEEAATPAGAGAPCMWDRYPFAWFRKKLCLLAVSHWAEPESCVCIALHMCSCAGGVVLCCADAGY